MSKELHPIVDKILSYDAYVKSDIPDSLSATAIISPIQSIILSKHYEKKIDKKLNSASLLGVSLHSYFEIAVPVGFEFEYNGDHYVVLHNELSMNTPIGNTGLTLTGTSDIVLLRNGSEIVIYDYKSCKDYTLKKKDRSAWIKQLSIYNMLTYLTLKKKVACEGAIIYFNKSAEAVSKFPFGVIDLELMSLKETKNFIMERALEIKKYWDLPIDELHKLPTCSSEESWGGRKCSTYCGFVHICPQINVIANGNYSFKM